MPDVPVHIVQRGHSRDPVFFDTSDYQAYLYWLREASERYDCAIHAYVLMTNHIHILATPKKKDSISLMMQYIGRYYVPYINYTYGTSGSIWEGRLKASLVHDEEYLLTCMRYIELNPVRANMIQSPGAYRWSSYKVNGQGRGNSSIRFHSLYMALGSSMPQRAAAYRSLFKAHVDSELKGSEPFLGLVSSLKKEKFIIILKMLEKLKICFLLCMWGSITVCLVRNHGSRAYILHV